MNRTLLRALGILCGVTVLSSCDFDIDPDPVVEDPGGAPPPSASARSETNNLVLAAEGDVLPRGTRTKDSRQLIMDPLRMTITDPSGEITPGSATITYALQRQVEALAPTIWKITLEEQSMTRSLKPSGDVESMVSQAIHPLTGHVMVRDGDALTLEKAGSAEEKAALPEVRVPWFGGNTLFTDKGLKRRESWALPPEVILEAMFGRPFTEASGSAHLFVQQTLDFAGHPTAEVRISLEHCRGITPDAEGGTLEVDVHGFGKIYRQLDPLHTTQVDISGSTDLKWKNGDRLVEFSGPFECRARSEITLP